MSTEKGSKERQVSDFTIRRLSVYYKILDIMEDSGILSVSSAKLSEFQGISSSQVRKDLSLFGSFG